MLSSKNQPTSPNQSVPVDYQPTPEQKARATALQRFHQLYLYIPLAVLGTPIIVTFALLIWLATGGDEAAVWQGYVSSIADMVIILTTLPLMFMCAMLPIGAIVLMVQGREKGWQPIGRLQTLLWRLESRLDGVRDRVDRYAPAVAERSITGRGWVTYILALGQKISNLLFGTAERK